MEPPSPPLLSSREYDVAIVGAGPVGLAIAIELSRLGLDVLVLDRRPPLARDARARPQLLVARSGDLAHLARLGVDLRDEKLVSLLATRSERDLASGTVVTGEVREGFPAWDTGAPDLRALSTQPPLALVPIARLQQALLALALDHGTEVRYGCDVTRLRRHARDVSLVCADGTSARAAMAIVATGAARPLIASLLRSPMISGAERQLIAGVFAIGGDRGRWVRVEIPVPGHTGAVRCTLLQTPTESESGTAVLVDASLDAPTTEQLHGCFAGAARELGLEGAPFLVEPQVFSTAVTEIPRRFIAGDGRAPVVIAGDAAQTGHVFSGQTCFVNVALALGLCNGLRGARTAIAERKINAPALGGALADYGASSSIGAAILAQASHRHLTRHAPGAWALAGIARA
jgi:2-polyprenyl-6-methoxyphenol hydroxylase-like FAD-dependent oxidoreductase